MLDQIEPIIALEYAKLEGLGDRGLDQLIL